MPQHDGTGPQGKGPKTGSGSGNGHDERKKPDQKKGSWPDFLLSVIRLVDK